MDADLGALPDDIAALKAALMIERAKMQEVAAELAVARAKAVGRFGLDRASEAADRQA